MSNHSQSYDHSHYSALRCILLLLVTGIVVKTGAAVHLCELGSCHLALNW